MVTRPLNVVLCWHMHQPFYREGLEGDFHLPWVYLHGLTDYTDMAAHLEQHPQVHAVVDFAPVLLEQIDIYVRELAAWLDNGQPMSDPLLKLLSGTADIPDDMEARRELLDACQRCNPVTMVEPFPAFRRLNKLAQSALDYEDGATGGEAISPRYLSAEFFIDLLVWYHLAWVGHSLREHPTVTRLTARQADYSLADRRALIALIHEALAGIIPRYRALGESGRVELAMTPYAHPIVPLLNDFSNMHHALPDAPAPEAACYPGGADRSRWHMQRGIELFEQHFGIRPRGVWLSEGGVSEDALGVLEEFGFSWTASGEGVWKNCCLTPSTSEPHGQVGMEELRRNLFRPYRFQDGETRLFFRDDGLSDLIGFEYQHWSPEEAANNFSANLENIAAFLGESADQHVVSIILDGENAWEHYPDNGSQFLGALYQALVDKPHFRLMTFCEAVDNLQAQRFERIVPGSWIYGSFSTWIGEKDKNCAWEALVAAKQAYDAVMASGQLDSGQRTRAEAQLAICESSDWFWWFGDYNPADSVRDFDRMFRTHLSSLYQMLGQVPPERLSAPFSGGNLAAGEAGAMRRAN